MDGNTFKDVQLSPAASDEDDQGAWAQTPTEGNTSHKKTTADIEKEIEAAKSQMMKNINSAGQRGEQLDTLQNKTDDLATQANGFRRGANRVRKQMWWKDMKMRMCIIVGIIVLLIVIIVPSGKCLLLRWSSLAHVASEVLQRLLTEPQFTRQSITKSHSARPVREEYGGAATSMRHDRSILR